MRCSARTVDWRLASLLGLVVSGSGCGGGDWVHGSDARQRPGGGSGWQGTDIAVAPLTDGAAPPAGAASDGAQGSEDRVVISQHGANGTFRNTYYDFPAESASSPKAAKVFDATCKLIQPVAQEFHDQVCVQGSGRLSTGETISFARRDCACAAICPRTNQKICFEKLDAKRFPHGRGATGDPVTPLRSVAVDDKVIPLRTPLFIPEYKGLPGPGGKPHDGCFLAEDRGLKVVGRHVDIFTGSPSQTKKWNQLVPSNLGVQVVVNAVQCRHLAPSATAKTASPK